jgi:multidrug efflux pump subunit AcrB
VNPIRASLRYPQVTWVLTAMLLAVGIHALLTMPRREDPKITIRIGLLAAVYPGATSEQVEMQVTRKIEDRLFRFDEVRKDKTYSTSRPGIVIINVYLEDRVAEPDKFWSKLRHDMNELRVRELPHGVLGPVVNSDFGDTVALLVALHSDRYGYRELKQYAERIEDQLRTVRAVSKLKRYGEQKEQILLTSSLERLSQYGLTPLRIVQALQARNIIGFAGNLETPQAEVPLETTGMFQTADQIRRVMVDVSPTTGQPVYLGDIGEVDRRYQDPDFITRINGKPCVMLSVEMQEGNNIVDFGREVNRKLDAIRPMLPPDLNLTVIADQPKVVEERVSHFVREFAIAIGAVVLVTMLLLPLRVATISAVAIPVTVAFTFGVLNSLHIELHQVSIAALIVVLGMVVDDAIVIADEYVELLDRGVPRAEAAWRCATELAVPVLTATLTIIASFVPLAMLSGSVGEFISALPVTVAVALGSSFFVAMLLTPLLCRFFIRKGLHTGEAGAHARPKFSVLDLMQRAYERIITAAMRRKWIAVAYGVAAVALGVFLLGRVPDRFFPSAERDQFIIDVWLPEGSRIEATDAVMRRVERELAATPGIEGYATFLGSSAPRFYYNVDPQPPATNYGQFIVNTESPRITPLLVAQLRRKLPALAPEARLKPKELQQGNLMQSPIEVRIAGEDLGVLKTAGAKVARILEDTPGSVFVDGDFHEDRYGVKIDVDGEVANRLGFANVSIAQQIAGGFEGAPVSTFWEGTRAVDIVLRLDQSRRRSFDDLRNTYLVSSMTSARVPLRAVATLRPEWQTSRIVRRNGVRTLTIGADARQDTLPSVVLNRARRAIEAVPLPAGYRLWYGGETESQAETSREMAGALGVSLVAIFLILLFQFRSVREPLIVMSSIPLALVGAAVGLMITGNPFGFTANLGVVSLSGIVVRNAIILVDYIKERRKQGATLEQAALEAGQRRLRPIFLTTMAAAVGVVPMIISRSSLWSPLASVISVGLLFSMFNTLVVVPVLAVLLDKDTPAKEALAGEAQA